MDRKLIAAGTALLMTLSVGAFAQTSSTPTEPMSGANNTATTPGGSDAGTVQKPAKKTTKHKATKKKTTKKKTKKSPSSSDSSTVPTKPMSTPNTANSPGGTNSGSPQ